MDDKDEIFVKNSVLEGTGVFAAKNFKKGEAVTKWKIQKILTHKQVQNLSEEESKYVSQVGKDAFIIIGEPERYINHSCSPNTQIQGNSDIAIRDIRKGEEITSDYSKEEYPAPFTCNCGEINCKKDIGKIFS